jgi:hypothetical protein
VKEGTPVAPVEVKKEIVSNGVKVVETDYVCFGTFDGASLECKECQFKTNCATETRG